jgi:hypothetical protein
MVEQLRELKNAVNAGQEELKTDINDVKTELKMDISTVSAGQEELRNDMNDVNDNISALETMINAGHEEFTREISDFQERIRAGQDKFEERVTRTINTRLEDVSSMVEQQTRILREELSRNIEAGQAEFKERVTSNLREDLSRNIEVTRDLETQLVALQVQTRHADGSSAGTNADKVKHPKFDGSTSWVVFQRQFDAAAIHNDWTPGEKANHLLSVLQGRAAHILHSIPAEASYEDIVGRCETDSETTSWRRLTDHALRPDADGW